MYVSLVASNIGSYALPPNLTNILGDRGKEDVLLRFAINNGVDSLSYYNLSTILPDSAKSTSLRSFIAAARGCGINEQNAIGSVSGDFDAIKAFGKFDGTITEIEFWNDGDVAGSFKRFLASLQYIRSIGLRVYTYLGWLDRDPITSQSSAAQQIAALVDRVYLHCYQKDAAQTFNYCTSRIGSFNATTKPPQIVPIFSAESPTAKAGTEIFMGDWLRLNSPDAAESLFKRGFANAVGYQYYDYAFMSAAMGGK